MSVKKLPGGHNPERQTIMNIQRSASVHRAKSGEAAEDLAALRNQDKNPNPPVKKINSNPTRTTAGVTPTSKTVNKLYRPFGGGGLGGGLFGNKNR